MILFKKIATFLGDKASIHSHTHATFLFRHFSERGFLKRAPLSYLISRDKIKIREHESLKFNDSCVLSTMAFMPVGQQFLQQDKVKLGSCHSPRNQQGKRDKQ